MKDFVIDLGSYADSRFHGNMRLCCARMITWSTYLAGQGTWLCYHTQKVSRLVDRNTAFLTCARLIYAKLSAYIAYILTLIECLLCWMQDKEKTHDQKKSEPAARETDKTSTSPTESHISSFCSEDLLRFVCCLLFLTWLSLTERERMFIMTATNRGKWWLW